LPFNGKSVAKAVSVINKVDSELGLLSNLTFNSVSASRLEGFFRISFDRTDKKLVAAAHNWAKLAQKELASSGFPPARTSIDDMYYDSGHLEMALALKKAVDPLGIISPGRYLPA
jgi:hypothetical protein